MVKQGQYIFDTFWNIASPAEEKIRSSEEGTTPEFIRTIADPVQIQQLGFELVSAAKEEILVLFSTANAFHRQARVGGIKFIQNLTTKGIRARVLTPMDDRIVNMMGNASELAPIELRNIEPNSQTKVTILIVDRKYSLCVELKDDSRNSSLEAIGLATYSNSRATVSTYASIFDSLWRQTELYDQLKEHEELQREFINTAAHELRTPIQPIIGLVDVLHRQEIDPEKGKLLEVISRNASRLHNLTENLLNVARLEIGALPLQLQIMDAADLVRNAVEDVRKANDIDKINLKVISLDDNLIVNADRNRLSQVIHNLLSNAVKFTKEGTISVSIERDSAPEGVAIISVRDRGPGIDPDVEPRLFTKFATRSENGLGLGLFIAKGIIDAHGGRIWAKNNEDGKGATFAFTLPIHHM
jgi:signal transduction histidine kinase